MTLVLVVLGGAGTGKTTVAAAAVRKILDESRASDTIGPRRALFLSFSRAAVSQILERTSGAFGSHAKFVEITTFHAFAWHLIRGWGAAIGMPDAKLVSPSEAKLLGSTNGITYDDLLPLALQLVQIPAIRRHRR